MKRFLFRAKVWIYPGVGGWHFVYVPKKLSNQIRGLKHTTKVARGYIRIKATIKKTSWETTLFPAREGIYLLAIKAAVRKKEGIFDGDTVSLAVTLL
jgi:hypothetical protein